MKDPIDVYQIICLTKNGVIQWKKVWLLPIYYTNDFGLNMQFVFSREWFVRKLYLGGFRVHPNVRDYIFEDQLFALGVNIINLRSKGNRLGVLTNEKLEAINQALKSLE